MDLIAIGKAIADLGGWAAFLTVIVAIGVALLRRWWVPGWVFDREVARADKSDTQAERNAESLETSSEAYGVMAKSYDRLERDVERLTDALVKRG